MEESGIPITQRPIVVPCLFPLEKFIMSDQVPQFKV
jgi:hypothetical protein